MEKHFPRGKKKKKGFETFVRAVRISCDPRSRRVFHQLSRSKTSKIVSLCFFPRGTRKDKVSFTRIEKKKNKKKIKRKNSKREQSY